MEVSAAPDPLTPPEPLAPPEPQALMMIQTIHIIPTFDVRQVLTAFADGRPIVRDLDESSIITSSQRCALVRILVSHLLEKFGENPTTETKKAMAASIIQAFPCLKDSSSSGSDIWYTPARNRRPASGYLEERLRNVRKKLRKALRVTGRAPHPAPEDGPVRTAVIPECTISDERAVQLKEWLRSNSQPLCQVETYMQDTAVYRAKWIKDNTRDLTISQILDHYPHLTTNGMIAQDFLLLHADAAPKLYETWLPVYAEKILQVARLERKLQLPVEGLTLDDIGDLALQQLPALLPPTAYKVGRGRGSKTVRHTIAECKKAFIDHQPPGINMVEYLQAAKLSQTEPYVLTLGNTPQQPSQVFAIIDGQAMKQDKLLQAVDVCFKAYYIFDIEYTKRCQNVWDFLQSIIYGIPLQESNKMVEFLHTRIKACQ